MARKARPPSTPPHGTPEAVDRPVVGGALEAAIIKGDNRMARATARAQLAQPAPGVSEDAARDALRRIGYDQVALLFGACILAIQIVAVSLLFLS